MNAPVLSAILLMPLAAVLIIAFLPQHRHDMIRRAAAFAMTAALLLTIAVYTGYDTVRGGMQYTEHLPWITDLGVAYTLGVDGISLPLLLLSSVVGLAAVFSSWRIERWVKAYFILLLLVIAGVSGAFLAYDLFFFLVFSEMAVIPVYLMVLIWGSSVRVPKARAAMRMTIFLLVGSAFMLLGVLLLYVSAYEPGMRTFDIGALAAAARMGQIPWDVQAAAFFLLLIGFGAHLSMFPLHAWSPDGYAGAPTAVSMVSAGVLKKIGGYALIRIGLTVLPLGAKFWAPLIALLAAAGVVYASYIALAQRDIKYMAAYSSISHMGYVLLGFAALNVVSLSGMVAYMTAHGIMIALLFSLIGYVHVQTGTRSTDALGGLARSMPRITIGLMLAGLCSLGLPGLVGFVPEFTIFVGVIEVYPALAVITVSGIIFTALYILRMLAHVLFGPPAEGLAGVSDARGAAFVPLIVLGIVLVGFGVFPDLLMRAADAGAASFAPLFAVLQDAPTILGGGQ